MCGLCGGGSRNAEKSGVYRKGKLIFPGVCTISVARFALTPHNYTSRSPGTCCQSSPVFPQH